MRDQRVPSDNTSIVRQRSKIERDRGRHRRTPALGRTEKGRYEMSKARVPFILPRIVAALAGLVLGFTIYAASAAAYNDSCPQFCPGSGAKWPLGAVQWHWGSSINVSGYFANGFRLASDAWVNAGAGIWPSYSSSAQAKADVYYADDGNDGVTYWGYNCCWTIAWFDAYGNTRNVPDIVDNYTRIKQVSIHEMGHGLGLGHSNTADAVMQANAPSTTLAADDINGLHAMYP
jgi:matrixin